MGENNLVPLNREILSTVLLEQSEFLEKKDLGVEREALKIVKKNLKTSYAIVISGLRRVGKSTLLAQIARNFYKNKYYFVNFEDERLQNFRVEDFNILHEVLISLFGEKKVFILDEIQNISGWERFVRRMIDNGYKFYLTGSNASLLSKELGTKLTGRYLPIELLPFSFGEYLLFFKINLPTKDILTTIEKGRLNKALDDYLISGGIPDHLKNPKSGWPEILYNDVLFRDVVARYQIEEVKAIKELSFYLLSHISCLISFNKLKNLLKLGSVNTVKSYIDYLESAWLIFAINRYDYSVKRQQIANKKVYAIDSGLVKSVAFSFSPDRGRFLENLVFLQLVRNCEGIYYYKTESEKEVDFYLPKEKQLIQVCLDASNQETKDREITALLEAARELNTNKTLLITRDNVISWLLSGKI
jgi:hypothetical protein